MSRVPIVEKLSTVNGDVKQYAGPLSDKNNVNYDPSTMVYVKNKSNSCLQLMNDKDCYTNTKKELGTLKMKGWDVVTITMDLRYLDINLTYCDKLVVHCFNVSASITFV